MVAGIISVIFCVAKFVEMRFVDGESKPLKTLIRDSLVVYVSVVIGSFILDQIKPIMNQNISSVTQVFTDNPPF